MTKTITCDKCNGRGYFTFERSGPDYAGVTVQRCEVCKGKGVVEVPVTNADHIRSMTDEELAERNVRKTKTPVTGQYDYGELYTDYYDAWETSDGAIFWTRKPAVEYELNWLKQPYKEDE